VRSLTKFLATGAYVGLIPVAPGTMGSLAALPLVALLGGSSLGIVAVVLLLAVVCGVAAAVCHAAGVMYAEVDSGKIVLDEICGMLIAGALIVPTGMSLLLTFAVFRLLDIVKPPPARYFDRYVHNGFGVIADDIVAGVYTNLVIRVLT
jgi:phosphatidylglycerophosphatase A